MAPQSTQTLRPHSPDLILNKSLGPYGLGFSV